METPNHLIAHLYGEADDPEARRALLADEALHREYEALEATRAVLEKRPRMRPDPQVIDRIMAAAAPARITPLHTDRPALRRVSLQRVVWWSTGIAAVLLVAVGVWPLVQPPPDTARTATPPVAVQPPALPEMAPVPDPPAATVSTTSTPTPAIRPTPDVPAMATQAPAPADTLTQATDPALLLAWDDAAEVRLLHERIERLRNQANALAWDEPARPLELLPQQPGVLQQTGNQP